MAEKREIFTILELSTGEGVSLVGKVAGDAVSTEKKVPAIVGIDTAGNYQLIPIKAVGDAPANAIPSLPALDDAGNLSYLKVNNATKALYVSSDVPGTKRTARGVVNSVIGTATDIATITLTASKSFDEPEITVSSAFQTFWELVHTDDATVTVLAHAMTSAGGMTFGQLFKNIEFASGSTGTQTLKLRGTQQFGPVSSLHAYVGVIEIT